MFLLDFSDALVFAWETTTKSDEAFGLAFETIVGGLITAISVLTGAVVFLFKQILTEKKEIKSELENCKTEHRATNEQLLDVKMELGVVKGQMETFINMGIPDLVRSVVEKKETGGSESNNP